MMTPLEILQHYWGYDAFRKDQAAIIDAVISGKDVLTILPTGGGKSICYQVPALVLEGLTIVISPLISLMEDQVNTLIGKGIKAVAVHHNLSKSELRQIFEDAIDGKYTLMYLSPERIQSELFIDYLADLPIRLVAIDEAHCISQWGADFRPNYLLIQSIRAHKKSIPFIALTASATPNVKADIINYLGLQSPEIFINSVVRDNLSYHVRYSDNKWEDLVMVFQKNPQSGILYCRSRKKCEDAATYLQKVGGIDASYYHAGMHKMLRQKTQQQWIESNHQIMCATTAFGMGIDKPNVKIVAHVDIPHSLEEYYQEVGRAGRDGNKSYGVLFYNESDFIRLRKMPMIQYPSAQYIQQVYQLVGDFLQIHEGDGFEQMYAFDISTFIQRFKLDVLTTICAVRILGQDGVWEWNDDQQLDDKIQLMNTDEDLIDYLRKNEFELYEVYETLLRKYGAIHQFFTNIELLEISKVLHINYTQVQHALFQLQDKGVLIYQPAKLSGTLFWKENRIPSQYFRLSKVNLEQLRNNMAQKIEAVISYLKDEQTCRNILLGQYFGDEMVVQDCGQCDNCRRKSSNATFKLNKEQFLTFLQNDEAHSIFQIMQHFSTVNPNEIMQFLKELLEKELIYRNDKGEYLINVNNI